MRLFSPTFWFFHDVVIGKNRRRVRQAPNKENLPSSHDYTIKRSNLKPGKLPFGLDPSESPSGHGWYDSKFEAFVEDTAGRNPGNPASVPAKGCSLVIDQEPETKLSPTKPTESTASGSASKRRLAPWKLALFSFAPVVVLFILAEILLAIVGVQPRLEDEDPFVGFVSSAPLFVEQSDRQGGAVMVTGANKRSIFNVQSFRREKAPGTYRIFCLGGSTTYGRPYSDETSFSRWLRELLPLAGAGRKWEVVNAGGISYASYRVAAVMEELCRYQPDLFVVYTGHNEFLEDRTYGRLRDIPRPVRWMIGRLTGTRTWEALSRLLIDRRQGPNDADSSRAILPAEVRATLDHSAGPALYERDDRLRGEVLEHFTYSLRRMVTMARSADSDVIFVTPASNLSDCSPFKSQHTDGLSEARRSYSEQMLAKARQEIEDERWLEALDSLDAALEIDPRRAELHYLRGRALLAVERYEEAESALILARDEDVCPLRALGATQRIVGDVARELDVGLVDFIGVIEKESRSRFGHSIPGEAFFLDHVHPTIEGHRLLALAIIEEMVNRGIVEPGVDWSETAAADVVERVEASIDPRLHARGFANLALVLDWAGKREESRRLAFRALESGIEDPTIFLIAARHLAGEGSVDEATTLFRRAVKANPGDAVVHSQFGLFLTGRKELEAAAAHFFLASLVRADDPTYHQQLALVMSLRGRHEIALPSLFEARRLSPASSNIDERIETSRAALGPDERVLSLPELSVTRYDSGYPKTIAQTQPDASGQKAVHGIWTKWFDGGGLKRFVTMSTTGRTGSL